MGRQTFTAPLSESGRGGGCWVTVPFDVRATFDALAFTHRREYAEWVGGAKRPETRERRAGRAMEMLRGGVRHP